MNQTAGAMPAHATAMTSLIDAPATRSQVWVAVAVCAALSIFAALALSLGLRQGPEVEIFLPITATMWSLADLLTALLLLGQFYFNGRVALAILAVAYATSGLLTWPYLFAFPGTHVSQPSALGSQSTFAYLWLLWHAAFPLLVMASMREKVASARIDSRRTIVLATFGTAVLTPIAAVATTVLIFECRNVLPYLVVNAHLQPIDRLFLHPVVVMLNVTACLTLLSRRNKKALQLWLCVTMFAFSLDSLLVNLGAKLYSYAWDAGKILAVVAAGVVLATIIIQIVRLYGQQVRLNAKLEGDIVARNRVEAALRASEERFRQIEEHAPIGLALISLDGTFLRVNPALCKLIGYEEAELLSTRFQLLTHPDDLSENLFHIEQAIAGFTSSYEMEKRYLHKDGHAVWVMLSASLVHDEERRPAYLIGQIQDITARKVSAKALEDAQRSALAAAEAKSRFLATMSHEIRTPMNGIVGMTELLSLSQLSGEQTEYVQVVQDSGRSLLRVLDDILDYSKIEAGKLKLDNLDFDLRGQIRSVVALLEPQYKIKDVALAMDVDVGVPPLLNGDPGRVRQILVNLVGNALKFTPAGGSVRIVVSSEPREGRRRPVRFAVVDTGIGIAPEVRHRLFRPFSQADGSTTRQYGGTGLGLSISKQLVDLMGGRIGVNSNVGSGSSFWFTIPFLRSESGPPSLDAPAREMDEQRPNVTMRPERLLLAEDNEVNTLLAIKQFKQLGFHINVVSNGREAVKACEEGYFDVVFMDCMMPVLDGFEATKAIRKLSTGTARRVPIIAMTANVSADDRAACLAADMDDYVAKPVSLPDLSIVLARWLPGANDSGSAAGSTLEVTPT